MIDVGPRTANRSGVAQPTVLPSALSSQTTDAYKKLVVLKLVPKLELMSASQQQPSSAIYALAESARAVPWVAVPQKREPT